MFKSTKNDLVYFMLLLKSIAKLKYYTQDLVTFEDFAEANEEMNFDASLAQFTQIGELINKISIETKSKYHGIPWNAIKSFRNQVVHEYFSIDEARVFVIIKEDIPVFEKQIWEIVEQELNNGNFALEEYNVAKNSDYYKIVNFKF